MILFGVLSLLFLGALKLRHLWEARHPAVTEHRDQLLDVAAKKLKCAPDVLEIIVEEPTRARVEGCGQVATFRWSRKRNSGLPDHWFDIDPTCRVDWMGCSLPCD